MKKQVTFAERQRVHRLQQDGALQRCAGMNETNMARCEQQHVAAMQTPRTMTAAPFLKHAALTPAQKEYLYTMAASYSAAHVRDIITQHYMNVLHRCIRTGNGDALIGSCSALLGSDESEKQQPQFAPQGKHKEKIKTSEKNPGKSLLPKIPNRHVRQSNISASKRSKEGKKHGNISARGTSPRRPAGPQSQRSPGRGRIRLTDVNDEEEEGVLDDSLSECLSSLSVAEWDDDTFSDL